MFSAARRLFFGFVVLVFPAGATLAETANTSNTYDVREGDRLAHTLCVNCHVVDAHGPEIRNDRVPSFTWIAGQKGLTPTTLSAWLSTSHDRMPDIHLTRDEIRQVSAYILSLKK